jgi:hypothetical protein
MILNNNNNNKHNKHNSNSKPHNQCKIDGLTGGYQSGIENPTLTHNRWVITQKQY